MKGSTVMKFLFLLLLLGIGGLAFAWYSAQSLPSWYEDEESNEEQVIEQLTEKINKRGVAAFLGDKFADVMEGKLVLSEVEFNALLLSSLQSSKDGRRLLDISEALNAQVSDNQIEFSAIIDLQKAKTIDERSRKLVEGLGKAMPFLDKSKLALSVTGRPIARSGNIAFDDHFIVKIGAVPIPGSALRKLGVPVDDVTQSTLPFKHMSIESISLVEDKITLGVFPRM